MDKEQLFKFYKEDNWLNFRRLLQTSLLDNAKRLSDYPNINADELLDYYFNERLKDETY